MYVFNKSSMLFELYFFKSGNKVKLEAANRNYEPINVDIERLVVQGKLVAVWRRA